MKLEEFLSERSMTDEQFSKLIGVDRSMVTKIKLGKASPSLAKARAIEIATEGRVLLADLVARAPAPARVQGAGQ